MNAAANTPGAPDISAALRELLLQRAAGKISAEEFERQQAGLHATLLAGPAGPAPEAPVPAPARPALPPASAPDLPGPRGRLNRKVAIVAAISVACFAVAMQLMTGESANRVATVPPRAETANTQPAAPAQAKAGGDLAIMVKRLAEKMAGDPKNGDGWLLLARTYGELQQPREAAEAYAKAAALLPADASILADWAAVVVTSQGNKWDEQSRGILKRALATDPKHLKSLALAGADAFARDDKRKAIEYWEQIRKLAPADSPDAKLADANLAEARSGAAGKAAGGAAAAPGSAPPGKPGP